MATAKKNAQGNYEVFDEKGQRISTTSAAGLVNFGLSPDQLSTVPQNTIVAPPPAAYTPPVSTTPAYVPPAVTTPTVQPVNNSDPSLVNYLTSVGQPNDVNSRATLATKIGLVSNPEAYIAMANNGTNGAINTQLLNILRLQSAGATDKQAGTIASSLGNGKTTNGVPDNIGSILGVGSLPGDTPISSDSLSGKKVDLASVLGAGTTNISSGNTSIDQLLAMLNTSTPEDKTYADLNDKLVKLSASLDTEGSDLTTALEGQGVPEAQSALKQLNLDIAGKKGALEKFDAETLANNSSLEDQTIPTNLIQGQQAAYQKQRNLTKLAMSADLAATAAVAQAYQGNIELGTQIAKDSISLKYAPVENAIKTVMTQIGIAKEAMNTADTKKANIISELLKIEESRISTEKTNQTNILTQAVNAAANGAPLSVVNKMKAASDPAAAAVIGNQYLKGNNEPTPTNPKTPTTPTAPVKFTPTQINKGASQAGLSTADFSKLPAEVQNYYVNNASSVTAINKAFKEIDAGDYTADEMKVDIDNSILAAEVKTYLKNLVDKKYPQKKTTENKGGGIGNFFNNVFGTIGTGASDLLSRIGL